ncbi:TniQ family protein [Paenirhodobacter populi]|uniref:TniQ family protein n=1 Tax=Paenirhodobacter populi TaxID=2306993 RepID=UPI0013E33F77|nr:TniQ family protein [Sinirhodobacter populi]
MPVYAPPVPAPRETLPSFVGRLAASHHVSTHDYAVDLGTPFKFILDFSDRLLENLERWGKIDQEAIEELVSWTGRKAGEVQLRFRGEIYGSRSLRNPIVRGCPICLREDAGSADAPAAQLMALRGDWQYRDCVICVRHRHFLVPLWEANRVTERLDSAAQFAALAPRILAGEIDVPDVAPTEYDVWLSQRLESQEDSGHLATQNVETITTISRLLGARMLGSAVADLRQDARKLAKALNEGFLIVREGPSAFRARLDDLATRARGALDEPRKAFGDLYVRLSTDLLTKPEFQPYRTILRDCIIQTWPLAAGEVVLGEPLDRRRIHSVWTAAAEANIKADKMEALLIEAGAVAADDDRPRNKKTFSADRYADLIAEIPQRVSKTAMLEAMGATRNEFDALVNEGVLNPRTRVPEIRLPWCAQDGLDLVADLAARADVSVSEDDPEWETIQKTCGTHLISLRDILEAIRSGVVRLGLTNGMTGYHGFRVRKETIAAWHAGRAAQIADNRGIPGTVSLAEFGRSVGFRDKKHLDALIGAGFLEVIEVTNPSTGRPQLRVGREAAAKFRARFVTVNILAAETGQNSNYIRSLLSRVGATAFREGGFDFGQVWLRRDVDLAF